MEGRFEGAKGTNRPSTSFASFVADSDTELAAAHTLTPQRTHPSSVCGPTNSSLNHPLPQSAFPSTSGGARSSSIQETLSTSAPSVEARATEPIQNPASEVFQRVVTPYDPKAFNHFLKCFDLSEKYPDLVFNLQHGFPIGNIPPPTHTYIPKNHKSALDHIDVIHTYCQEEVSLGRMSGPFSADEVFNILGGHFVSSPLGVVEKAGEPGKLRVVRDLSFQNPDGYSVNGFLDSDDFPTEWGTAAQIADIVSVFHVMSTRLRNIVSRTLWPSTKKPKPYIPYNQSVTTSTRCAIAAIPTNM